MGKGGYHGASTIVIPGSRKWQSEDFYALPLEPRWKALLQRHAQADAGRQGKRSVPVERHINDSHLLREAIMERNPALLEATIELVEARRFCRKNVNLFRAWLTQKEVPFCPGTEEQLVEFSWNKARKIARGSGLRARWPPKGKNLSLGDYEILKRVCGDALHVLRVTYPSERIVPVIYIDDE